jgi:hypothetical protein
VAAAVVWSLVSLRAETLGVSYLDDSSLHEQMVRFATQQFASGHLPLTSWFPFLGLGSPQFLHYQSLPAMLTGLGGVVVGPDVAFRWSLYLLLSLWPVSVYLAARLFGAGRPAAATSAAMSPFLASATGIGYEQHAYLWVGFGVWTQLWASITLPLAWGFSWRALREGRGYFVAVALTSLTIALHFETGYLALIPLVLWPLVSGAPIVLRARRAVVVIAGSVLAAAWVIVPLLEQRAWAAVNEPLHGTGLVNGYGAGRVLGWLVSGQLLDHGRLPVITVFAAIGLARAGVHWRKEVGGRALVLALTACLVLSFGRTTFGPLVDVLPGAGDIFFRRFMMGAQLAALLLAGSGADWAARMALRGLKGATEGRGLTGVRTVLGDPRALAVIATVALILVLAPAWLQLGAYDRHNAAAISAQRRADATQGAELGRLLAVIRARGGGRVYAGMPTNWGTNFTVGAVPVFKYLETRDVDEVGYTLRTASLMTDPEYYFDENDPGDYQLFGIHYLIVPSGYLPPVRARLVLRARPYSLWTVGSAGYVHVGRIAGRLEANRTDVGVRSIPVLRSRLAQHGEYLRVAFGHGGGRAEQPPRPPRGPARRPRAEQPPRPPRRGSTGAVIAEADNLRQGEVAATVSVRRPGVAVLGASFDPGWTAFVDGHRRSTEMVAPALVSTTVPAGTHRVVFRYRGFQGYPLLFTLCALTLIVLAASDLVRRRLNRRRASAAGRA